MFSYGGFLSPAALAIACVLGFGAAADAQYTNYGQAYQKMLQTRPDINNGTDRYLYNKYFKTNPAVSPYISGALLGGNQYDTAYGAVVRPEQQRRAQAATAQAQYVQQRKLQGNVGYTANPGALYGAGRQKPVPSGARTNGAYQNHWYGSWNK